jgi:hypothetical protein
MSGSASLKSASISMQFVIAYRSFSLINCRDSIEIVNKMKCMHVYIVTIVRYT